MNTTGISVQCAPWCDFSACPYIIIFWITCSLSSSGYPTGISDSTKLNFAAFSILPTSLSFWLGCFPYGFSVSPSHHTWKLKFSSTIYLPLGLVHLPDFMSISAVFLQSVLILQIHPFPIFLFIPPPSFSSDSHYHFLDYWSNLLLIGLPLISPSWLAIEYLGMVIPLKWSVNMPSTVSSTISFLECLKFNGENCNL